MIEDQHVLYHISALVDSEPADNIDFPLLMIQAGACDGGVLGSHNLRQNRWDYAFSLNPGIDLFTWIIRLADEWHDTAADTPVWVSITYNGVLLATHINLANLVYGNQAWATLQIDVPQKPSTPIVMLSVDSSHIKAVGYDSDARALIVEFCLGDVYSYAEVDQDLFLEFLKAESKGKFFHQYIKGVYQYTKLDLS